MLRLILRTLAINFIGVYLTVRLLSGIITFVGDLKTLLFAALAIALINIIVRPIINLLLLPIHLITLGLFRWLANLVVVYIITLVIPNLRILPFVSPQITLPYLIIPPVNFSVFGAFIFTTLVFSSVFQFLYWLFQD